MLASWAVSGAVPSRPVSRSRRTTGGVRGWTTRFYRWRRPLEVPRTDAAERMADTKPTTCGVGIAEHAAVPAALAVMFQGLAESLELHRTMLVKDDANARKEDEVYGGLAASWTQIAELVRQAA